jgi:L-seryl-tRNA(Ser) seleniumtransferase
MGNGLKNFLRSLPSMEELLSLPWVAEMEAQLGRETVKDIFDIVLDGVRRRALDGEPLPGEPIADLIETESLRVMRSKVRPSLRPVVNATGVVVHTNLGRSALPREALEAVESVSLGYSTLEYSLEKGSRGGRNDHVEWLVRQTTGAESAIVVNNNAGAVLLALTALARGREVIVSRGELVEIGGAFRIPEILSFSGARMVEVGCTNRTRCEDYRDAITDDTSLLLKVHPSNFRIEGFTESASREELAELAHSRGIALMEDLGSGLLEETGVPGLRGEPTVRDCLRSGVDVVTFSGDKLLGGPQIGCVAGAERFIDPMREHQLIRALRVGKMTLAAFEAILRMHVSGREDEIPTVSMLRTSPPVLREKAKRLRDSIADLSAELSVEFCDAHLWKPTTRWEEGRSQRHLCPDGGLPSKPPQR